MRLEEIVGRDLNRLPYFVKDEAGEPVPVYFAPLVESDRDELLHEPWSGAVFAEAWLQFPDYPRALKLVCDGEIVGLLHLGERKPGLRFLTENLLESRPGDGRRGVGRVLVARLVVESYNCGAEGQVRVKSHRGAEGFYRHLGFHKNRLPYSYDLMRDPAQRLFEGVTEP